MCFCIHDTSARGTNKLVNNPDGDDDKKKKRRNRTSHLLHLPTTTATSIGLHQTLRAHHLVLHALLSTFQRFPTRSPTTSWRGPERRNTPPSRCQSSPLRYNFQHSRCKWWRTSSRHPRGLTTGECPDGSRWWTAQGSR